LIYLLGSGYWPTARRPACGPLFAVPATDAPRDDQDADGVCGSSSRCRRADYTVPKLTTYKFD